MTALDHATSRGEHEIADYLRSIGGRTAQAMGWVPPPPPPEPELSQVLAEYFEAEYLKELGTIHGMVDSQPSSTFTCWTMAIKSSCTLLEWLVSLYRRTPSRGTAVHGDRNDPSQRLADR